MNRGGPSNTRNEPLINPVADPTQRYQRGLNTLKDTQRMVNDSEQLGAGILGQLGEQRHQIEDAIERNQEIESNNQRASRLIRTMLTRAFTIKMGLYCFAFSLLMAILLIVYLKWIQPEIGGHSSPPPPSPSPGAYNASGEAEGRRLTESDPQLGDGLVALIAIGSAFLFICIFARASTPAKKSLIICCLGFWYIIIVLFLVLLPKYDSSEDDPDLTKVENVEGLGRVLLFVFLGICALVGPGMMLGHAVAVQKAPVVEDAQPLKASVV
tara:strand:+ start:1249 stop:2055 length:807 start_codon:yes stop_codon:yes gene_type:complete